jgi:hypothetical protein
VNNLFEIATALASITSYEDVASALAGLAFAVASASMFVITFWGAM